MNPVFKYHQSPLHGQDFASQPWHHFCPFVCLSFPTGPLSYSHILPGAPRISPLPSQSKSLSLGLMPRADSFEKTLMLGKIDGRRRRGRQRMRRLDGTSGHESEQTLGDRQGQGSLACRCPWDRKELNTEQRDSNHLGPHECRHSHSQAPFWSPFPLEKNSGLLDGSPQEARGTGRQLRSAVCKASWNLPIKGILITPGPKARTRSPCLPIRMLERAQMRFFPRQTLWGLPEPLSFPSECSLITRS